MKKCIIKRYYESKRDKSINQTVFLKGLNGGEQLGGEWSLYSSDAYVFSTKSRAKSVCKSLSLDGLSLVEV